jgi:hypothetical protein
MVKRIFKNSVAGGLVLSGMLTSTAVADVYVTPDTLDCMREAAADIYGDKPHAGESYHVAMNAGSGNVTVKSFVIEQGSEVAAADMGAWVQISPLQDSSSGSFPDIQILSHYYDYNNEVDFELSTRVVGPFLYGNI